MSIHNMVAFMIDKFGSDFLKKKYLGDLTSMSALGSYCLTEPNSGSDAASLSTLAVKKGDEYILNGEKAFISGGGVSDFYIVMARTGKNNLILRILGGSGSKGISAFLVPKGTNGLSFGKKEKKMGWNSSTTAAVILQDVCIPDSHLIGMEGQGFSIAMHGLNGGRVNIASCSLGGATSCLDLALDYVKNRSQFSSPLVEFQSVQFKLADIFTALSASRLMIRQAAVLLDNDDQNAPMYCAMAKVFATDACFNVFYSSFYNYRRLMIVYNYLEGMGT